ncbi:MAG TPA: ATP-binding cassette domain-containing protein [Steroidobacteraceae bacterium]|nr:ATP-binding cassette domain-containing protein [Steroidobacteraceae bacterium]
MRRSSPADARYVEVSLRHLGLRRGDRAILGDVSWSIRPGQRWVLVGPNGAGKTQLLKVVSGAVWPVPGKPSRRYRWRHEAFLSPLGVMDEIGYIGPERQDKYERYGWNHTVTEIVGTGLYRTDIPLDPLTARDRRQIAALLHRMGIEHLGPRRFLSLSYGERRLALLSRVLAARPKLLLLDELLSGLDAQNRSRALGWLERTGRARLPWVLTAHRLEDVPRSATHALVLNAGRIKYRGSARGAPLKRWLVQGKADRAQLGGARRSVDRLLLRLTRASVYVDEHRVLEALSFTLRSGECWVVHGANGSGKSTLLRTLYGDHRVAAGGRIERSGVAAGVPLELFRRRVGLVAPHLQSGHPHQLTVSEVVQSGPHASIGLGAAARCPDRRAASHALELFGLQRLAARALHELSYGQLRRVLFARAWACRPALLLLDEPYAGVDARTRRDLMHLVEGMLASNTAVVMATHHRREWPTFTTHEIELSAGRALYCGPVRSPLESRTRDGADP